MDQDDHVCLCFSVSLRKLRSYLARTKPVVPSQLADCLGAGTGCRWCVPFLRKLHAQWQRGELPDLPIAPETYAARRAVYRTTGRPNAPLTDDDVASPEDGRPDPPPQPPDGQL